jgi:predicted DNA-binding transcriptional regulator YafY
MYNPTLRLLAILELLQSRGEVSGQELAQTLEVEERSVRRYIMQLRDMGIPIEGERGRHGGYALQPGYRLPPLMFNADEITAIVMGLMLIHELRIPSALAIESASAKIERVLPDELRTRADALRRSLAFDDVPLKTYAITNEYISTISLAVHEHRCLNVTYVAASGDATERVIAPYGLVMHATAWYIPAYCFLRQDVRTFRLDRVRSLARTEQAFTPPPDFDARDFVLKALARLPEQTFEVIVHASLATVEATVRPSLALLEPLGENTLLRCFTEDPHWLARVLAGLELPFAVRRGDSLREALRELAARLVGSASL